MQDSFRNFSWVLPGALAGSMGPMDRRHLIYFERHDITAMVRMEEDTISGEPWGFVELFDPVADFGAPSVEQIDRIVSFVEQQIETWERPTWSRARRASAGTAQSWPPTWSIRVGRPLNPSSTSASCARVPYRPPPRKIPSGNMLYSSSSGTMTAHIGIADFKTRRGPDGVRNPAVIVRISRFRRLYATRFHRDSA